MLDKVAVAKILGCGTFHANELMTKGKLGKVTRIPVKEGSKTMKKVVEEAAVETYKNTRKGGIGKRADGRNKYTTYFSPEELTQFNEWANPRKIPVAVRANPPKSTK